MAQSGQSLAVLKHEKYPKVGIHENFEIENFFLMPNALKVHETSRSGVISKIFFWKKIDFLDLENFWVGGVKWIWNGGFEFSCWNIHSNSTGTCLISSLATASILYIIYR